MFKCARKTLLLVFLALLVLITAGSDRKASTFELAISRYQYDLLRWEVAHFMDKWLHQLTRFPPWTSEPSRQQKIALVEEFFSLGREMQDLERQLLFPTTVPEGQLSEAKVVPLREHLNRVRERRRDIQPQVEETVESEVSAILSRLGFDSRIGFIFPPVDTVFSSSPHVLVVSPRDRIFRQKTILLTPDMTNEEKAQLEILILQTENLAALVEGTGGVASYPSVVSDEHGLHYALVTTAHEWLHHWFFFHPLGQHFWSSPEMTTLNETAATLGGIEIGDLAFQAVTGKTVDRTPPPAADSAEPPAPPTSSPTPDPNAFDFNKEMRQTRLRTEELLAAGKVEEAEAYMEERRQLMVAHGYLIRKINQAYFAFHGSYATGPASISPIDSQLRELRQLSDSLEDFLKTVARFSDYQEFLDYLEKARATTAPAANP